MKLFIKILLFVFVVFIANVKVVNAFTPVDFPTTSNSFHKEIPEIGFKVIFNDFENCCQSEQKLVDYRNWDKRVEATVAKTGTQGIKSLGAAAKGFSKIPKGFKEVKDFGYQHGQKFIIIKVNIIQRI